MAVHEFALELPENLYRRAERAARLTHCEIEDILVSTLETVLPILPGNLPSDLATELAEWAMLDDEHSTQLPLRYYYDFVTLRINVHEL
jgi:hypothetical protein